MSSMKNMSIKTGVTTERKECAANCATDKSGCTGTAHRLFVQVQYQDYYMYIYSTMSRCTGTVKEVDVQVKYKK